MSHWAELDEDNVVIRVLVGDNNDPNGDEGYQWFVDNLGGRWVQTSYNGNFRGKFAGINSIYNEEADFFYRPFSADYYYDSSLFYFAKLNPNNIVVEINTINKLEIQGPDKEAAGIAYLKEQYGSENTWKQTKMTPVFRKNFAQVGYTYDASIDAFIPPMPLEGNWVLDARTYRWEEA
jgi:hypothetical protein